jgi:hypothetical protein
MPSVADERSPKTISASGSIPRRNTFCNRGPYVARPNLVKNGRIKTVLTMFKRKIVWNHTATKNNSMEFNIPIAPSLV